MYTLTVKKRQITYVLFQKGLILGVYEGDNEEPIFTKAAAKFNDHLGGKLLELLKT